MLVKCICTNCAGHLAFEEGNAGTKIDCPHCGFETTLYLPGTEKPDPILVSLAKRLIFRRRLLWLSGASLILAALLFALLRWGMPLGEALLPDNTAKAWIVALLLLLALASPLVLALILFWLAMPVLVFFQLRRLAHTVARIEVNLRPTEEEAAEEPETEEGNPRRFQT